ncbi:GNAT family N-acetyltransferase [Cytophagaceae bacterium YF14B1]|uniref:GNAT family N-acetyltransferase n=1 Tax=Xanthocytophaga flava TaxID=3048013 RepID=A0AAE3QKL1_9BACT|nr:GNAT family N-acetyltransferase [Xanthocytophaga flavus]MDJ1480351.1 GNAT family N-acetyltransferase [Xanthocytophaga flavus]
MNATNFPDIIIRKGTPEDIPSMLRLVKELAEYEKAPDEVENTEEKMLEDGFGPQPVYGLIVAELEKEIVGISVYYFRYSTWKGKRLYLEDIVVTEPHRGKKIGRMLFNATMQVSLETNCNGMLWQVLDWNTPAIEFYKKYNAHFDGEWINCSLSKLQIQEQLSFSKPD